MSDSKDNLSQRLGVLTRREVEARIMAPVLEALGAKFGDEEVREVVKHTVIDIAKNQGAELASAMGGCGSSEFLASLSYWTQDNALEIDILDHSDTTLNFNVNRCRYAELYNTLGIPELGAILSCNRDFALIEGFNEKADLTRTQTIMAGASHCNFRYQFPEKKQD